MKDHDPVLDSRKIGGPPGWGGTRFFVECRTCKARTGYEMTKELAWMKWGRLAGDLKDCTPAGRHSMSFRDRIKRKEG